MKYIGLNLLQTRDEKLCCSNIPRNTQKLNYRSGQLKYVGQWREGSPHGNGTYLALNGDKYEGQFRRGVITGPGTITQTNGNTRVLEDSETIQFRNSPNKYLDFINTILQYLGLENFFQKYRTFYDNFIWPNLPG